MKRPLLLSLLLLLTLAGRGWAQTQTITGRVTDEKKEAVIGAGVVVKGNPAVGTTTDVEGNFSLAVPEGSKTLEFKYIGYKTIDKAIGTSTVINATLSPDTKELGEAVITVLGVSREKRAVGYAVSSVKADAVVQKSEPDVLRTLSGKVPGVNIISSSGVPGSSSRITIRGNTSFFGNNQPLFIVDGVPFDNSQTDSEDQLVHGAGYSSRAADIDPNNIADIQILKGATAAALYGSRAAGGVIVITTKTGSGQKGPKGIQIGYSTGYSIEKIGALPDYQNNFGAGANSVQGNVNGSWGPAFNAANVPHADPNNPEPTIAHPQAGNTDFPNIPGGTYIPYKAYPNNVKDFFQTGHLYENSVSLNGTGENASFNAILSRADQTGTIPFSSFTRNNFAAGGSGTYNKFTVAGSVSYTNTDQKGPQLGANNAVGNNSAFARILFLTRSLDLQGLPYIDPVTHEQVFAWLSSQADNPRWSVENNSYTSRVDRVTASTSLSYAIKSFLTLSYTGGVNTYTDLRRTTVRAGSNGYGGIGNVVEDNIQNTELEQTTLLTFNKNLNENFNIRASVGQNINQRQFSSTSFVGSQTIVFGIDNIENTLAKNTNGYDFSKRRLIGYFGDLTLNYKEWAFLTGTGRFDQSSTLNKDGIVGQSGRSFFYPSVNGSLILNDALNINKPWLSLLKVRAGYARVGRDANPYAAGPQRYTINPGYGNFNQGIGNVFPFRDQSALQVFNTISNPGLTPEFTTEFETGGDLSFFKNRIAFNGSYYDRRSTNQIAGISLPAATGYGQYQTNFGEISNKGVELQLVLIPVQTQNFTWTSTYNFTHNKNIVERLDDQGLIKRITFGSSFGSGLIQPIFQPGQPYGVFYGSAAARDENGNPLVNANTGLLVRNPEPKIIGNPNPQYSLNFINQFTYKGITLNVLIDYRKGGDLYSTTLQSYLGRGVTRDTEDRDRIVVLKGTEARLDAANNIVISRKEDGTPKANTRAISVNDYYFGTGSAAINGYAEQSVYDATTVRLREITLGYSLPKALLSKTPFGLINISFSGRNLYWYSPNLPKYTNFDPETSTFGASNNQGFEYTNAPSTRRYGVNLRVNF